MSLHHVQTTYAALDARCPRDSTRTCSHALLMEMGAEHCFVLNFWKGSLGARIYSPGLLPARSLLRALTHSCILARTHNASVCEYEQQKAHACAHFCHGLVGLRWGHSARGEVR